ncbi:F-box domain-containing protein [Pleurostoma richardsiae]|uniref:F-box domain-containing protein n=1 Tax=Pleurostoma richardsiae TaxID=41990 RepID=A0AA38VGR0_9PEZI|nr:F-box domain-containing protein [Pleurostoma richardsiae]
MADKVRPDEDEPGEAPPASTSSSSSNSSSSSSAGVPTGSGPGFSIWGRLDAEDETLLPTLPTVSEDGLRNDSHGRGKMLDTSSDDYYPVRQGPADLLPTMRASDECRFPSLPSEIIAHVLSYLSAVDLVSVSATCRLLRVHAKSDHLWQALVQSHVPGTHVTSAYPCDTFRELYVAHDPRWFLPKYKIWFCDRDLAGKLIVVRYDQRRGCIEGYQLLANHIRTTYQHWAADSEVIIHAFEPEVKLHLDKPVLQLRAHSLENLMRSTISSGPKLPPGDPGPSSPSRLPRGGAQARPVSRFMAEMPMPLDDRTADTMYSNFMLARPLPEAVVDQCWSMPFPYGNVWPPPAVPARHRVSAASLYQHRERDADRVLLAEDRPTCRAEMSDQAFRIRSWMEMRLSSRSVVFAALGLQDEEEDEDDDDRVPATPTTAAVGPAVGAAANNVHGQATRPWRSPVQFLRTPAPVGVHIGEEVTTYATLDPALYTPTRDKPWRGVWVGDYSGHGCEFLLINQVHPEDATGGRPSRDEEGTELAPPRRAGETEEEFLRRREEARVYRGRLEAVKLTGDPNVPRGEYTFVAEDLGEAGFVAVVEEEPFRGARVVRSKGHVAGTGFLNDRYIESQLLLISHDRLAQYWVGFGHISFFERVDIDRFLVPN